MPIVCTVDAVREAMSDLTSVMSKTPLAEERGAAYFAVMSKTLLVIDIQNDYFAGGRYPLWNTEATLAAAEAAIGRARASGVPVVLVQHVASPGAVSPLFNADTDGVEIHPRIAAAAPGAPVVVKHHA